MPVDGFSQRWRDFPDYIIGITQEIWESRGIGTLRDTYAPDLIVRTPMGISRGNKGVMAATMATLHEFPDRRLFADNVIWCDGGGGHLLSSHHIRSTGTHLNDGAFGSATGKKFRISVIADCAARNDAIDDEWLVRDYGGIVRQLGMDPQAYALSLIEAEGGAEACTTPYLPENDIDGPYLSAGNDNEWGARYADTLMR
ncbi:MAG: ester cyclase, partial [Pseudomonadota bacterium]